MLELAGQCFLSFFAISQVAYIIAFVMWAAYRFTLWLTTLQVGVFLLF